MSIWPHVQCDMLMFQPMNPRLSNCKKRATFSNSYIAEVDQVSQLVCTGLMTAAFQQGWCVVCNCVCVYYRTALAESQRGCCVFQKSGWQQPWCLEEEVWRVLFPHTGCPIRTQPLLHLCGESRYDCVSECDVETILPSQKGSQMAERLGNWAINQKVVSSIPGCANMKCVLGQGTSRLGRCEASLYLL